MITKIIKQLSILIAFSLICLANVSIAAQSTQSDKQLINQHSKPKILLMMSSHASKPKGDLLQLLAKDQPFELVNFSTKGKSEEDIKAAWSKADLIMLDGINPALSKYMFGKYKDYAKQFPLVPVISLGDLQNTHMNVGLAKQQAKNIASYYNNAGRDNYRNMMLYLANDFLKVSEVTANSPIIVPSVGLYHYNFPGLVTADEEVFFKHLDIAQNQPVIAIGIHRSVVDYEQQQIVDALIKGLEAKGAKALAYFFEGEDQAKDFTDLLTFDSSGSVENSASANGTIANKKSRVDLLINYRSLHFVAKRRGEFEKLGVPVLHALNYTEGEQLSFEADNAGISPSLTPFFLVMPEDTGSADPTIIAANGTGNNKGVKTVIDYQLNALVERAYNHANLAHVKNKNKKIATFIWNYPPGEKNIGAAFLDVPTSIENIAKAMKEKGYNVDVKTHQDIIESAGKLLRPYYRGEDAEQLISQDLAEYMPVTTYLNWFNALPENVTQPIIARWGKPEESGMIRQAKIDGKTVPSFVIPRMNLGNMIVMPQGVRGEDAKEHANLYHSTKTPINHSYLAIYLFARETFGADAYINLGTHGSVEWLTGKERGLSVYDAPSLALGNLPVFYPYIIDNVGEAMQAKRRGRATMISHLTPGFAKAGLYTEVADLSEKINNYLMLSEGQTKANTQAEITKMAEALNMLKDLSLEKDDLAADFDTHIAKLQDHLNALAQMSQPLGVHIFGDLPKESHLFSTMLQMLGDDFTARAAEYEQAHNLSVPASEQFDDRNVKKLYALDGFQLVKAYIEGPEKVTDLDKQLVIDLTLAKTYWDNFQAIAETQNLMLALDANYIPTSYGGDPIRNPDAAPTGRNLIGFNPAKVPSKEAYDAGVILMNQTIDAYVKKHGKYPEKLAFSLWSLETMRHQGALEAQILHALGLKPKWNHQGHVVGTDVIPYSELKRPRIDVVISATGLYRDAFPNVMLWIAKAIDKVAKMKEDNNFVYRHAIALKTELLEKGKSEEDADYLSSIRIFSNETGNYGTGLAGSALASDTWETDDKLAKLYLDRMGFAYGHDEKRWSENVGNALGEGQGLYSKVLSGTDGVIFSRSTNLYALMTNDDPFQYFGGIGLAVRHLDGKTPEMYVSNLRKKDQLKSQTLDEFVNQEMRSRYFHPRWIKAMQDSGYAGATAILDRMNNMWGWEVMTPEAIRDDQWQEFFEVYVEDKYQMDMREFFEEHNAESLAQIIERMLEAVRKGYWDADEETIKKMVETYSELATQFDVATDNVKFNEYMDTAAIGFGMMPLSKALAEALAQTQPQIPPPAEAASQQTEQVSGQKLEEQAKSDPVETDYSTLYWLFAIFFIGLVSHFARPTKKVVWVKSENDSKKTVLDKAA